jgi:membrane fusion protein (multidrug efflux system)
MAEVLDAIKKDDLASAAPVRAPRSSSRVKMVAAVVLLALAAAGGYTWRHYRDRVSSDDAQVDGHIDAISSKVPGNVTEVLVGDNRPVKAGDVLVRIDPRDYQAKVDIAKAAVLQARNQLETARTVVPLTNETTESGTSLAGAQLADATAELERSRLAYDQASTSDVAAADAAVQARQANNDRAQADLARMKPLLDKAEISQQQYDAYSAAARVAESDLRAAQEKLGSVRQDAAIRRAQVTAAQTKVEQAQASVENAKANRKQVDVRRAETGSASAALEAARANLAAAELQLSYTTIVSPADGVVTRKNVEPGQVIQPGQGLMTVIQLQNTWVTANFKETQLDGVRPGQRAEIRVDMYGRSVAGHVDSIASATGSRMSLLPPENATGNFVKVVQRIPVKILVDRSDGLILRPGMNVDATIFLK